MPSIHIGDDEVSPITSVKYLGVQVDQYLNWEENLLTITKSFSLGIRMLRLAKCYLPLETIQMNHRSLIEPYLRYCCPVWGKEVVKTYKVCKTYKIELRELLLTALMMLTRSRF